MNIEAPEQECRHDLLPGLALTRCYHREENCDTESGVSMATFTCQEQGNNQRSAECRHVLTIHKVSQGKLSRQLPDDV